MNPVRLATIALVFGAVTAGAVYGQAPGYGARPPSQPQYRDDQRHNQRGYDDRRYDRRSTPRGDVGFFYDELSPYGDWVMTREYGWAWFPTEVHPYWRPYSDGRWVATEYGWTWVSYEPFGWATYHYGRWAWDPRFGWLWVPGTTWGPAWVSWQYGGGYVGWAPLPPSVEFEIGFGIRLGGFDLSSRIRSDAYSFVPERSFLQTRLSGYFVPTARNVTIIRNSNNITNYTYDNDRVVNRGVEVRRIEQVTGRRVESLRVTQTAAKTRSEVGRSEVRIFRPGKQQLDSVRVGPAANAGSRDEAPPASDDRIQPQVDRRDAPEFELAPRILPVPRNDPAQLDRIERREQQDLQKYQAQEKLKLQKLQAQEIAKARAQADREQIVKQHQAELEALQQGQRNAAQQLEVRLKAQRQAALANASGQANPTDNTKAVDQKNQKDKKEKK